MEEEIDRFSLANRFLDGERDRIDAVEFLVRAGAHEHLQARDNARTPRLRRFERDQALFELFFVDHGIPPLSEMSRRNRRSRKPESGANSRCRLRTNICYDPENQLYP
jgi:hypothetical protein